MTLRVFVDSVIISSFFIYFWTSGAPVSLHAYLFLWYSWPSLAFAPFPRSPVFIVGFMENKRDAASAGLAWPTTPTRTSQNPTSQVESAVVANPPAPTSTTSAPSETLTFTSGTDLLATPGMYTAELPPATPFPPPDHPHPAPHRHSRFTERVVHQIRFKIFTHSNNERELFIEEIPTSGISKSRDPEHFFYGLSGDWEWSKQTSDYWRHHFEFPLLHGNNPFRHVAIETIPSSSGGGHVTTTSTLARQLLESLTAATASGELPDSWRMLAHMSFPDAIQALQQSSSSASESTG